MNNLVEKFNNPSYYNNRELSWLSFNERVLQEASDHSNPLLERLKFIAITSSNLDEFFMVRVAGLKDQVKVGYTKPENKAGLTPLQQLHAISKKTHTFVENQQNVLQNDLMQRLKEIGIVIKDINLLNDVDLQYIEKYFEEIIYPILTPLGIDAYRPFPKLLNKSLNIIVDLTKKKDPDAIHHKAIVQIPGVLDRFIKIPTFSEKAYVLIEQIILKYIDSLFTGYDVNSATIFRITRNADLALDEEGAQDLLEEIEKELKKRRWGAAVRLEVERDTSEEEMIQYLVQTLEIENEDVYIQSGFLDLTSLFSFVKKVDDTESNLVYSPYLPKVSPDVMNHSIMELALDGDLLFHHPYESFQPIVDFIEEAANDPQVLSIKMTLYRVSGDSPIIKSLKKAAENNKQVTVLVELKARFDEENNVHWARELEESGCHVIYGFHNLKTHSKILLVVRQSGGSLQRFVHLSTGNYNDQTANVYTDHGYITSKIEFADDATEFFNFLSGYTTKPKYERITVAPFDIQDTFIQLIDEEIEQHRLHGNGHIIAKMNSLTDKRLIMKLYEASEAGVKIDCIIRGICCMKPGIKDVSENIRVISIIGRFLEHSRIYYFHHNGEHKMFLSSADMMTRNMMKRVEILFPIVEAPLKKRLLDYLNLQLNDNMKARYQDSDGNYHYVKRNPTDPAIDSQETLRQTELYATTSISHRTPAATGIFMRFVEHLKPTHKK